MLRSDGRLTVLSLSREQPAFATRLYEWGHTHLPALLDCRPIYPRRSLAAAGFAIITARRATLFGLPIEVVVGRTPAA